MVQIPETTIEMKLPEISVEYLHTEPDDEGSIWIAGTADIGGIEVDIGCWEDSDHDGVWSARDEAHRVIMSFLSTPLGVEGVLVEYRIGAALDDERADRLGTRICAALRDAYKNG